MNLQDYKYVIENETRYREDYQTIFDDPRTTVSDSAPEAVNLGTVGTPVVYIAYKADCPLLNYDYFANKLNNQFVSIGFYINNSIIWFYKQLVIDNQIQGKFPQVLYNHPDLKFSPETQLPIELQNAMILK